MSIYQSFGTDKALEQTGIWIVVDTYNDKEVRFKISRMSRTNKSYVACFDRKIEPYRRQIELDKLPADKNHRITLEVFCESVLLAWENVVDLNGKEIEYTFENACKLMNDLPDLYTLLVGKANSAASFKDKSLDIVTKN
jgi:hypothetical protein